MTDGYQNVVLMVLALEVEGLALVGFVHLAARHCRAGGSGDLGPEFLQLSLSQWCRCLGGTRIIPTGCLNWLPQLPPHL